ncbi:MAG: hypothetical protein PVH87_05560 [Desulfobacteraceae bacterium]|jgi:hypothetical protein
MLSSSFDICEFIDKVKDHSKHEILYLADREATEAERHLYKHSLKDNNEAARSYAVQLKDIVLYMRHGVRTRAVRQIDLSNLDALVRA